MKKYGKTLLIQARDLMQAKMLIHLMCSDICIFDSVRPRRTFNYCLGIVFNYALGEFSEDDIYAMCLPTIQKVWKVIRKG